MSKNTEDTKKMEATEDVTIEESVNTENTEQAEVEEAEAPQEETIEDKLALAEARVA